MKETEKNPHTHGGHPQEESHMSQGSVEEDSSLRPLTHGKD